MFPIERALDAIPVTVEIIKVGKFVMFYKEQCFSVSRCTLAC